MIEDLRSWRRLSVLLGTSAALILPSIWPLERALALGRRHWLLRLALIAAVATLLWTAIPIAVQYIYAYFAE